VNIRGVTPEVGSLLGMVTVACANCEKPLDTGWKFCIHCGSPVPAAERAAESSIPSAIRPGDDASDATRKQRFDWQLGLGLLLAVAGVAAIVYLVSALIAAHA
jgi:hypothetical protein